MGRQSSRIYFNGQDHKEMVTWNGTGYQYHDKAFIWTGNNYKLVWEKLKDALWFKKTNIYFYQRPAIIRNIDGSVKFFIDYNPNSQVFRRVELDGTEQTIASTCFQRWDSSEPQWDYSPSFSYTDSGKMPVLGDYYRLTKNQDSWLPFSLFDMDNVSSIVPKTTLSHLNYRTAQGSQAWIYNVLGTGFRWAESNDNFRGMGMYYNSGSQPIDYYLRFVFVNSSVLNIYEDKLYSLPQYYEPTSIGALPLMIYKDFNSGSYVFNKNFGTGVITIFSSIGADESSGIHPAVRAYEYELPIQTSVDRRYTGGISQLDEGTLLNYSINGTEVEFYIIDIMCRDYVPFDFSTFEFHIMKHGNFDLEPIADGRTINSFNIIGDGSYGYENFLYMNVGYVGSSSRDSVRYDIENYELRPIYHIRQQDEVAPVFTNYGVDENLTVVRMMRNAPNYCLCEIVDEQPNE